MARPPSPLIADLIELGGAGAVVVELSAGERAPLGGSGAVLIGLHRASDLPVADLEPFDILLSADPAAPPPWVGVAPDRFEATLDGVLAAISAQPVAASVAAQVLRASLALTFEQALAMESLAYSMLLASEGFKAWRAGRPVRSKGDTGQPRVLIEPNGATLRLRLNRPEARNAFDAAMRDALCAALQFALDHPDQPAVELSGEGPAFSAGGDLDEFGSAGDVGEAHLIRTLRSPGGLLHRLRDRVTARLHGACVGAGIEVPAAAGRVTAAPGAFFRLPEVSMGLIPGAGGTASIPRRIGRCRAAYMAISGADIDVRTALDWGLIDAVETSSPIGQTLAALGAQIAVLTGELGRPVAVETLGVLDRRGLLALDRPGLASPNRACRLFRAADDWMVLNLARDDDRDLIAAWLQADVGSEPWETIQRLARGRPAADLLADGIMLGLPLGRVGEIVRDGPEAPPLPLGRPSRRPNSRPPRIVDMSALGAGPMCGAILAEAGAEVLKVESARRPDPTRGSMPAFFDRLNGRKRQLQLDLADGSDQARLRDEILAADLLITSARPRAFVSLNLSPEAIFAAHPSLVWVAVTGYGWTGEAAHRVAFGDDAAAAGGLVRRTKGGAPRFLGDALADPVTGLAAALGALEGLASGGGVLVDVSLAGSAAGAAAERRRAGAA